jgi:hypothetical protein
MGVQFNGQVTINGNVEMFDNGSMKITGNQVNVDVTNLKSFIEDNLKYSPNKNEYLDAADAVQTSNEKSKIHDAVIKLQRMAQELGTTVFFNGLSSVAIEVIKGMLG